MNTHFRDPHLPPTTQAAEGLARRRWSVAEIEEMTRLGVFEKDERFELIGGEIVPMSPKGNRHEILKIVLNEHWMEVRPKHIRLAPETTLRFDQDTYLEPDFVFYEARLPIKELAPRSALLVVEISDSSLGYDLGRKAHLYAVNGVRELWVMDAVKLETHVHRDPSLDGYRFRQVFSPGEIVTPASCAELAVRPGSLQLV